MRAGAMVGAVVGCGLACGGGAPVDDGSIGSRAYTADDATLTFTSETTVEYRGPDGVRIGAVDQEAEFIDVSWDAPAGDAAGLRLEETADCTITERGWVDASGQLHERERVWSRTIPPCD